MRFPRAIFCSLLDPHFLEDFSPACIVLLLTDFAGVEILIQLIDQLALALPGSNCCRKDCDSNSTSRWGQ